MAILETHDLRKIYGSGDTEVRALQGLNNLVHVCLVRLSAVQLDGQDDVLIYVQHMIKVSNGSCIRRLGARSMRAARARNAVAALAG